MFALSLEIKGAVLRWLSAPLQKCAALANVNANEATRAKSSRWAAHLCSAGTCTHQENTSAHVWLGKKKTKVFRISWSSRNSLTAAAALIWSTLRSGRLEVRRSSGAAVLMGRTASPGHRGQTQGCRAAGLQGLQTTSLACRRISVSSGARWNCDYQPQNGLFWAGQGSKMSL